MNITEFTDYFGITDKSSRKVAEALQREKEAPLGAKEIFLSWTALSRPESKFLSVKLTRALLVVFAFIGILLVLMQEVFLIFFVASLGFFGYVLTKLPPEKVKYEISNHGVSLGDKQYYWEELRQFFFSRESNLDVLNIDTRLGLPGRLFITIDAKHRDKIKDYLENRLHFISEMPKTIFDKIGDVIADKFRA